MSGEPKVLLLTLWQRTSTKGNDYLTGFFGQARVIGFRGEPTAAETPTWDIYIQPGNAQLEPRSPTSSSRTGVQRWAPKAAAENRAPASGPDPERPFFDDPVDDLGGERSGEPG